MYRSYGAERSNIANTQAMTGLKGDQKHVIINPKTLGASVKRLKLM